MGMLSIFVALGCALGGICRYWGMTLAGRWLGDEFPWGTLFVNVIGSFLLGAILGAGILPTDDALSFERLHAMTAVGLCGGLTTFSTFSLQNLSLFSKQAVLPLALNILLSVGLCLLVAAAGYSLLERWTA